MTSETKADAPSSRRALRRGLQAGALLLCVLGASALVAQDEGERKSVREELADGGWIEQEMRVEPDGSLVADGAYQRFDAEGTSRVEGELKDGQRTGKWRWRDERRKSRVIGNYRRGERSGEWSFRDAKGNKRAEGAYRSGARQGKWDLWAPGAKGRPTHKVAYEWVAWENVHRRVVFEGHLADGRPDGPWRFYGTGGELQVDAWYGAGRRTGTWRFFHADGTEDPAFAELDHGEPDPLADTFPEPPPPSAWGGPPEQPSEAERAGGALPELGLTGGEDEDAAARILAEILRAEEPKQRAGSASSLGALGRGALVPAVNALVRLDLAKPEDAAVAEVLASTTLPKLTGQDYGWGPAGEGARLAVLRWHSFAALQREELADWPMTVTEVKGKKITKVGPPFRPLSLRHERLLSERLGLRLPPPSVVGTKLAARFAARSDEKEDEPRQAALADALAWLAAHQHEKGFWDCDGFAESCGELGSDTCDGPGYSVHDVGVTGLTLLAFLADGNTPSSGEYQEVVAGAVAWLVAQQDRRSGEIGKRKAHDWIYNHAIATLALADACCLAPSAQLKEATQRAVDFLQAARNEKAAWRYNFPPTGDNDTSVTGWALTALEMAREAGLRVDPDALAGGRAWIIEATHEESGRTGYDSSGSLSARTPANEHYPREKAEPMTGAALFCRILLGDDPEEHPILAKHADLLRTKPPAWDPKGFGCDVYSWYYGTYAMHQYGGQHWETWKQSLLRAALDAQRKDGDAKGSWDPVGPWGYTGGRVYSTAMVALCLEAEFRYGRILEER